MYAFTKNDRLRFATKIKRYKNSCWLWTGYKDKWGYGRFKLNHVVVKSHRVAYEIYVQPIPIGLLVLHKCDNPPCVRPSHLFLGTVADNILDKVSKGRAPIILGNAKLTLNQVLEIRNSPLPGVEIANRFGVSRSTVSEIRTGKHWKL